ncbi:Translocating chain-associated membrane protein 1-like 1 [Bagarius yarrelli]|uniref:Translocating chain-associated membrane protein 1-like 1 n=1 Tax=Bagarius yarrelli TaxID=175774 RepID=A0A556VVW0_BAGYA|nr:Translocating chain-associated membrane protein 1-like 1 [Bagarius yarrelli]
MFITVQYNVTQTSAPDEKSELVMFYQYGPKDMATVFFYLLIAIILHALIQEYVLDVKFFYICQMAYWFHALPELYFQKVRKEDIPRQLYYICLYIFHITGAYVLNLHRLGLVLLVPHYLVELLFHASRLFYFSNENKQKGFTLWALLFVVARLLTLTLSVLTFGFGLSRTDNQGFSLSEGNFNVLTVRMTCLSAICLTQAWMMWKFINFQLKKWREQSQVQSSKKKSISPKNKPVRKDSSRECFGVREELWRSHGGVMEESWRSHGGVMEESWWSYRGVMEELWGSYGGVMEESWRSHGGGVMEEFMEESWRSHGGVMEELWRSHRGVMEESWRSYGGVMEESACLL